MTPAPAISIVLPVRGAAPRLGETLESLARHGSESLEVIIQAHEPDAAALAAAQSMAQRDPARFRLFVERDAGFAEALERGFARAHGEILGVLGAWDVLLPGALLSVASEIDPARGRLAVLGGCTLIVEALDTGVEHPAEYPGRFDHLAIWKRGFNPVPLPSLFWHRDVAARIGRLAAGEPFAVGYDLVCRIAAAGYRIQRVSASWSATRLEGARSAARRTEHEMLQEWIAISRRHWGSWLSPLRWRCAGSLWLHRRDRHEHARHHARRSEQAAAEGRALAAAFERMMTWLYSPAMARGRFQPYRPARERKS